VGAESEGGKPFWIAGSNKIGGISQRISRATG
jgi:hypothetical protein